MHALVEVHPGSYHDSVTLMAVGGELARRDGVDAALMAMATQLNLDLLAELGFEAPAGAGPGDLVLAVRAADAPTADATAAAAHALLAERATAGSGSGDLLAAPAPPTVAAATKRGRADVALVSTPGEAAFTEAMDALRAGLHVVVFSDNVPIEQEQLLKRTAAERGLLVMGPDCGTVVLGGVGLGFANVVRPGPVSLVAASGTGAQQVSCLLAHAGVGVNHVLGVGGRDLSDEIGAATTAQALRLLDDDPATQLIGLVAKSASSAVLERIAEVTAELTTPVLHVAADRPGDDLTVGTDRLIEHLGTAVPRPASWPGGAGTPEPGALRGLFSGGTLCREALTIAEPEIGTLSTNLHDPGLDLTTPGHLLVDLGADEMTRGRPHPMIDQLLRLRRIEADAADPATSVLLLDVVLGHGAHPDPAAELAPTIGEARRAALADGRELGVVVSVIGTPDDPQGLSRQAEALASVGADVFSSNAEAARHAVTLALGAHR
ncbi:MAG: FdrA family protein [Actinomycetota bacterium]